MSDKVYKNDHDLIIGLHTKMDAIMLLLPDYEKRIRKLESMSNFSRGALALVVFFTGLIEPFIIWKKK